jgi:hypothetical protein
VSLCIIQDAQSSDTIRNMRLGGVPERTRPQGDALSVDPRSVELLY